MLIEKENSVVWAVKDEKTQLPIPSAWRLVICEVVKALVNHDYNISDALPEVEPISAETATQIREYIQDYGETLTELPKEAWSTSVCIWMGEHWDALIDLWTISEGRSDLVLSVKVTEANNNFRFHIYMVYVP